MGFGFTCSCLSGATTGAFSASGFDVSFTACCNAGGTTTARAGSTSLSCTGHDIINVDNYFIFLGYFSALFFYFSLLNNLYFYIFIFFSRIYLRKKCFVIERARKGN